ncbi:hypothetical protein PanWU01x14_366640, partial [Parasponia andersonii]
SKASQCRKKNTIIGLISTDDQWCEDANGVVQIIEHSFNDIFHSSWPSEASLSRVTDLVSPKVTDAINVALTAPTSMEEIKQTIMNIGVTKAPGRMVLLSVLPKILVYGGYHLIPGVQQGASR